MAIQERTVDQILAVISYLHDEAVQYNGVVRPDYAFKNVARKFKVSSATLRTACVQRLGIDGVGDFRIMVEKEFRGEKSELANLIIDRSPHSRERVEKFFEEIRRKPAPPKNSYLDRVKLELRLEDATDVTIPLFPSLKEYILAASWYHDGVQLEELCAGLLGYGAKTFLKEKSNEQYGTASDEAE